MFTLYINNDVEMNFNDYTSAIGTFYTLLGTSCIQRETKDFTLAINDTCVIREVSLVNGKVVLDDSVEI